MKRIFLIDLNGKKVSNLELDLTELKLKNEHFLPISFLSNPINTVFAAINPFLRIHRFYGNIEQINSILQDFIYFPKTEKSLSSTTELKKITETVTTIVFDEYLEMKKLNPIVLFQPIKIIVKQNKLSILSSYCYNYNCEDYIKSTNINNTYNTKNTENRNIIPEIGSVSDQKGSVIQKNSGDLYIYEDTTAYISGLKVVTGPGQYPLGEEEMQNDNRCVL